MTLPINELCDYYLRHYPVDGDDYDIDGLADDCKILAAEVERLAKVIERLSGLSADGERYGYGDKVYYVDPCGFVQGLDVGFSFRTDSSVPSQVYYPYPVYKQHESAEQAARGAKEE